ncbi:MAG: hypothetical protein K8R69_06115 [Deltaproteobacteria bacterium]|nr:hypothetical protein [Deltaproteobacteria bacterium]
MKNFKGLLLVLLFTSVAYTGCSKNEKTGAPEATNPQEAPAQVATSTDEAEKTLVDGCEGSGDFLTPFKSGDFKAANGKASCAFNDSVKANPDKPDTQAAMVGFLSRVALSFESPEAEFLLLKKISAISLFGPSGNLDSLDTTISDLFGGLNGWNAALHYFRKQLDAGHNPNDVVGKLFEFIDNNLGDMHVFAKAMARDPEFLGEIPGAFYNKPAETTKVNFTDASAADFYVTAARAVSKVFSHYDIGLSSAAGLVDLNSLAADLNADAKFLSLKSGADASAAGPFIDSALTSVVQAVANFKVKQGLVTGEGDAFPHQLSDALTASQLKESLQGHMVFIAESDYTFAIDLKKMLSNLPDAKNISVAAVKVSGTSLDLDETFIKQFIQGFTILKE